MLILQILPGNDALESVSPFCLKAVYFLDLMQAEYKIAVCSPRDAPRGQLPCLDDDGTIIADSAEIVRHVTKKLGRGLFQPEGLERAHGEAAIRISEDSLYWVLLYAQFTEDAGWLHHGPDVAQVLPGWLRWALLGVVRRANIDRCEKAGVGRMPADEVYARGAKDLQTLATLLGDKPFLCGDEPSAYDLSPWSMLACFYAAREHISPAARAMVDGEPVLHEWVDRLNSRRKV